MKNFFAEVRSSIWDPEFYRKIPSDSLASAFLYITKLGTLLALIATIGVMVIVSPSVNSALYQAPNAVLGMYPDELVLTIENGIVSTNVEEPYFIYPPKEWVGESEQGRPVLVIDTKTPFSFEQLNAYGSVMWLTKDRLVTKNTGGKIESQDFQRLSVTISEQKLRGWIDVIVPYFKFVLPGLALLFFIALVLMAGSIIVETLLYALGVLLYGKLAKFNWTYGQAYRITLHAVTLPFILYFLNIAFFALFGINHSLIIAWLMVLLVVHLNFSHVFKNTKNSTQHGAHSSAANDGGKVGESESPDIDSPETK